MQVSSHARYILEIIRQYEEVVLVMHANPDGDAIGSALGMAWFLQEQLCKNVCIYNESPFPNWLSFLLLPCTYYTELEKIPFISPLVICLDAGDVARFGDNFAKYLEQKKSICIDHHLGNSSFATEYNWVDPTMAATGQMVAQVVYAYAGKTIENVAKCLYVALSCDTGNFTFGNTTSECIQCLAKLVETPLAIAPIREAMDNTWTVQKMHFWGELMRTVRFDCKNRVASIAVAQNMYEKFKVSKEDLEGFVEYMRRVKSVRFALLLREERKNGTPFVKVSMRSAGEDDVRSILVQFGGGGHKNAAGAGISDTLENVYAMLLPHLEQALQE